MTDLFRIAGQFHPAVTRFPVAMLMVAALAEVIRWWKPAAFLEHVAAFNLDVGAVSGIVAAAMGWWLAETEGVTAELRATLLWHRWLGIGTASLAVVLVALWHRNRIRSGARGIAVYRVGLLVGAVMVSVTGHLGSTLVYGLDWYQWAAK